MAAGFVLITIDGVLAEQGDEPSFAAAKLLPEGMLTYKAMASLKQVVLVSLRPREEAVRVEHWLRMHNLVEHVWLLYDPDPSEPTRGVKMVVDEVRRSGALELAVEADPRRAAQLVHHGASTLVFGRPTYTRGEFKPNADRGARPWDEVIGELEQQRDMNSEDHRISADVAGSRFSD